MNNYKFKVFLSGGGLKGAYQYGFFKKLYKIYPEISIEKVYAVSVGALNAAPIIVKKIDLLDEFWNNNKHPCDNFIQNWYDVEKYPQKALGNIYHNKALFEGIKDEKIHNVWNKFNTQDIIEINRKLCIVAFDKINRIPVFLQTTNINNFSNNIKASINMPFLFSNLNNLNLTDGYVVPIDDVIKYDESLKKLEDYNNNTNNQDNWIIIDLSSYKKSINIMEPINLKMSDIKELILQGENDAVKFVECYKN